jgi:secretion/DNA translocation related TadE-like protein
MNDRGAVTPLMLAVALVIGLIGAAVTGLTQIVGARWQATIAADSAALAAAPLTFRSEHSPAAEAAHFASLNGARLVHCDCPIMGSWDPRVVAVVVEVEVDAVLFGLQRVRAQSRAEFRPIELFAISQTEH